MSVRISSEKDSIKDIKRKGSSGDMIPNFLFFLLLYLCFADYRFFVLLVIVLSLALSSSAVFDGAGGAMVIAGEA